MRTSIPILLTEDDLRILAPDRPEQPDAGRPGPAPAEPGAADPVSDPARPAEGDGWDDDGPSPLWSWR
ncbi:hypothetical protein [Embleya sp. MST-111070]|uniref:hypothetical protein n=1 Tax=Embleya sp. MST-111070 TaxID=3398231 RepID=UPI003F73EFDD